MTAIKWLFGGAVAAAALVAGYSATKAADLGGNCCADLEERVAELEATTARKGNRKVKLVISGEVSKALLWHDIDGLAGADKFRVIDNPNSGTKVRFSGEGKIGTNSTAGFVMELGYDETKGNLLGVDADDMTIRHSFAYLSGVLGKISLGRTSTATDGIVEIDLSGTNIASLPMSVEPLWTYSGLGGIGGGILNPVGFDGSRANIVRYDSPLFAGFTASAAWGGGQTASGDDVWDMALRWAGEFSGIRLAAGAGYRVEDFDTFGASEMKTLGASASVMHVVSGLFLNGAFSQQDAHPLWGDSQMWQIRGGMARNVFGFGNTAPYLEYAQHDLKDFGVDSTFWGAGIVQTIDAAAMDVFVAYRVYDIGGVVDVSTGMLGARIKF
jgi:hypothetical protein